MTEELAVTLSCHKLNGKFDKKIRVTTNDPNKPSVTLVCKGQILEAINVSPKQVYFPRIARTGGDQTKKVVITKGDAGPINLKLKPNKVENLDTKLTEVEPGEKYELEVTIKPPFKTDRIRTQLVLETGVEKAPEAKIVVSATVTPRVTTRPVRFVVPRKAQPNWEQCATLVWDDKGTHKILGATCDDPDLKVTIKEEEGKPQRVCLQVPEGYKAPRGVRNVTIKTDDDISPTVKMQVRFSGARPRRTVPTNRAILPKANAPAKVDRTKGKAVTKDETTKLDEETEESGEKPASPIKLRKKDAPEKQKDSTKKSN